MPHNVDLILTLAGGLTAALLLGFITQKCRLSPLVGYLLAGIIVGPYSPGFVADASIAAQFSEIGVALLMFGVGLHFHLKDLLAVQRVALPGAVAQIAAATILGMAVTHFFGWSWGAGAIFGISISVASTVVLTRVLADNNDLHTPGGHVALGWLVVEDLFTILVLVLLPALVPRDGVDFSSGDLLWAFGKTLLKLGFLVVFTLVVGQKLIPLFLSYVARTGARDLFTLSILVLALGIAVGAAQFFGASMALGAFLAGMVVGQSNFSARAAAEALPMRDAFAVLFFVAVGMLFDPASVLTGWPLMLSTLAIVMLGKPLAAFVVVWLLKKPLRMAMTVSVALAQIGEFSFILAALGISLGVLPAEATGTVIVVAIISITLNPLLYRLIDPVLLKLADRGIGRASTLSRESEIVVVEDKSRVIVAGYGPVGRNVTRILRENGMDVVVIEMNIDTVRLLKTQGIPTVYGDARQREVLLHAGLEKADSLILSSPDIPAVEVLEVARDVKPGLRLLVHTHFLSSAAALAQDREIIAFSGESEVAMSMTGFLLRELGATEEQIERERRKISLKFWGRES